MPASWLCTGVLRAWPLSLGAACSCPGQRAHKSRGSPNTHCRLEWVRVRPASTHRGTWVPRGTCLGFSVPRASSPPARAPELVFLAASQTLMFLLIGSEEPDSGEAQYRQLPASHHCPHQAAGPQIPAGFQRAKRHCESAQPLAASAVPVDGWCRGRGQLSACPLPPCPRIAPLMEQVPASSQARQGGWASVQVEWVPPAPRGTPSWWWCPLQTPCFGVEARALLPLHLGPTGSQWQRQSQLFERHLLIPVFIHPLIHSLTHSELRMQFRHCASRDPRPWRQDRSPSRSRKC